MRHGEYGLKNLLDPAIEAIDTSGQARTILRKYPRADFKPIAPGYIRDSD